MRIWQIEYKEENPSFLESSTFQKNENKDHPSTKTFFQKKEEQYFWREITTYNSSLLKKWKLRLLQIIISDWISTFAQSGKLWY